MPHFFSRSPRLAVAVAAAQRLSRTQDVTGWIHSRLRPTQPFPKACQLAHMVGFGILTLQLVDSLQCMTSGSKTVVRAI